MKKGQNAKLIAAKRDAFTRRLETHKTAGLTTRSATMKAYQEVARMDGKTAERIARSRSHVGIVQIRGGRKGTPAGVITSTIYSDEISHLLALDDAEAKCSRWKSLTMFSDWQFSVVDLENAKI